MSINGVFVQCFYYWYQVIIDLGGARTLHWLKAEAVAAQRPKRHFAHRCLFIEKQENQLTISLDIGYW